jgi:hypothetical protein
MAAVGSPILFSDYDALQSLVQQILGSVTAGTGYGQTNIRSAPYPFIRNVSNVTRGANPTVTANNHNLVAGEVIYFYDISSGMLQLNDTYATVVTRINDNQFTINVNTSTFTAWAGVAKIAQYIVSANQFNSVRTDIVRVREHQTGTTPSLLVPTRGTLIQYSSFLPFFNAITTANAQKFFVNSTSEFEPGQSPNRNDTDWFDRRVARLEVEFPSQIDARQFFNTGGYIEFESNILTEFSATGNRTQQKNNNWKVLLDRTPVRFGANTRAAMGNRPGNWTSLGYYNVNSSAQEIYRITSSGVYSANYFRIEGRTLSNTRLRFDFEWFDGHVNQFAQNVTGQLELRFKFVYADGPITLSIPPTDYTSAAITYIPITSAIG